MQPEHPAPNRVREDKTIPMESSEHCLKYERGVIWFDDGSMIIVVEATAFRVFKGIMVQHSEVFCDMFAVPQPADVETWEGCPVIHVSDTKADIVHILSVIFDINYAGAYVLQYLITQTFQLILFIAGLRIGRFLLRLSLRCYV